MKAEAFLESVRLWAWVAWGWSERRLGAPNGLRSTEERLLEWEIWRVWATGLLARFCLAL